ncbi:Hybrid signal transduction histidine kinase J [Durusdinium trenchii]|uniref:Hybrid signal transduction histidine kinase J n=1 Tax=Durusdinium trenchii TaxID=1381693 RepID=A0ABP0LT05_9DINO
MNPCRCGYGRASGRNCGRGPNCEEVYQARISGPLLDRMDLCIDLPAVTPADLAAPGPGEDTQTVAKRVSRARQAQTDRAKTTNAALADADLSIVAAPDEEGKALLSRACETLGLSARAYMRILRVARTLADLDGANSVARRHIAEAISFRQRNVADKAQTNISELIVICDADGLIRFVSRSFAACFGASAEKWMGRPFAPGDNLATPGAPAAYRTVAKAGGQKLVIDWEETVLGDGERLYAGTANTADMEGYQAGKEARAAEDMRWLATMSHEMRTPLNGILGMTGLLLDTTLEPNQRAYAESVRESGVALLALINDLLDFAKIEAGRLELDAAPFSPNALIESIAELLSPRAADKGIEIAAYVDSKIPAKLYGDEARLRQVLINLAGNAVKFTDEGGVSIEAHLIEQADTALIRVDVRDTGIGIPEPMQATIFQEFSQAKSDPQRNKEGTGLGLAIARKIVHAMNGEIVLKSVVGRGSIFSFEVALDYEDNDANKAKPIDAPVIVATKSPVLARSLKLQLRTAGARDIIFASSVEAAQTAIADNPGAVLLCDIYLAGEGASRLAETAERSFVLLSPLARDYIPQLRSVGFDGYFIKPIRQSSLYEQLSYDESLASGEQASSDSERQEKPEASPKGFRVLLAEDNQINAVLATTILKRAGHHVELAKNGREAVEAVQGQAYDVILMDMHMPDVDGVEAAREIRGLESAAATTPIVALTANAMASDRQKCIAAGMDDFLSKPFEPEDLTGMIDKWAGSKSAFSAAS